MLKMWAAVRLADSTLDTGSDTTASQTGEHSDEFHADSAIQTSFEITKAMSALDEVRYRHDREQVDELIRAISGLTCAIKESHSKHETNELLRELTRKVDHMAKTQAELAADIKSATAQLQKIGTETSATLQKVTDLQAIIDAGGGVGGTVSQELIDAVAALQAQAQTVDDLVPDAAPPAPPA